MEGLRLYRIEFDYIKFLWTHIDKKVQYRAGASDKYNEKRPYIGVVFVLNDIKYFTPLEHPRPEHKKLKSNPHIIKIENGDYGIIALGNMIPVIEECLIDFDINKEPDDYKRILLRQFIFCRKNHARILKNAKTTYNRVTVEKSKFFLDNCCDFKKLETEHKKYLSKREDFRE